MSKIRTLFNEIKAVSVQEGLLISDRTVKINALYAELDRLITQLDDVKTIKVRFEKTDIGGLSGAGPTRRAHIIKAIWKVSHTD